MKIVIMLAAAVLVAGCAHSGGPEASGGAQTQAAKDKADLAAALRGRTPRAPQDCVDEPDLDSSRAYGKDVILFSGRTGEMVYVNRLAAGCPGLDFGRAIRTQIRTTQLCRGDVVTVFDPVSGTEYGTCALGVFTPYRRAR
jgi:hypothetical protein